MSNNPRTELFGAMHSLYQSRDYSDLIVLAEDGSRHPVHRAILCPRSQYFASAVKERRWREGKEGHITVPEDDPEIVRLLIEYFYLLDYEPLISPPKEEFDDRASSHLDTNSSSDSSDVMSIRTAPVHYGHVYGTSAVSAFGGPASGHPIQPPFSASFTGGLRGRDRSESELTVHAIPNDFSLFGRPASRKPKSGGRVLASAPEPSPLATSTPNLTLHAKMYAAGSRYGVPGLKALALDKFKIQLTRHWGSSDFAEAIHVVYNSTPSHDKEMREVVADTLGWHNELLDKPEVEVAILEINGLAYELLKRSLRAEPEYN